MPVGSIASPYTALDLSQIGDYTQDAIFSRGPKGVRRTGLFIGGRDPHLAVDMLKAARAAMVPPFEISVFADPSGAFTTAAGMVACAEKSFHEQTGQSLQGKTAVIFGGTGPVGTTCALLAAQGDPGRGCESREPGQGRTGGERLRRPLRVRIARRRRQQR